MKEIVKFGLVMGVLLCGAIGAASAQEEFTEDYKNGFYDAAMIVGQATFTQGNLVDLYYGLGGESAVATADNEEIVEFYNNQTAQFNEQLVPYVNGIIDQIFGPDDDRTEDMYLGELPLIS
ncbi:MAG: hypothetical protein APR56_12540 [Methanosaeta sp. SDB]|jgi:hypothetical protein|uniref:Uncharacterized protein n=1 Tax=Methanothrix harundinacea TaxID=301375 RepID=A0A101FUY3_9EURY|nr:MAG: hypothetical protein APR56_12540 [Methanosaeta sp. SDB]KUK44901.1 MAG: Uncharacterized protein XD72_0727 [Methanothrix harundinacea]KUK97259.1 MAG: Uncharacterized protein XE07_0414 [Methanothrix harundinacea]